MQDGSTPDEYRQSREAHVFPCRHGTGTACLYPRQLETAAAMCRAMSDPARMRLLVLLAERERCVSEIVAHDESRLTSISARLQMLYAAKLVARRREAKHVFYSLADEHVHLLLRNVLGHAAEKH